MHISTSYIKSTTALKVLLSICHLISHTFISSSNRWSRISGPIYVIGSFPPWSFSSSELLSVGFRSFFCPPTAWLLYLRQELRWPCSISLSLLQWSFFTWNTSQLNDEFPRHLISPLPGLYERLTPLLPLDSISHCISNDRSPFFGFVFVFGRHMVNMGYSMLVQRSIFSIQVFFPFCLLEQFSKC